MSEARAHTQLVESDERGRVSLGSRGKARQQYRLTEQPNGALILEPAVVLSEMEVAYLRNAALVARVNDDAAHPERARRYARRPSTVVPE